MYHNQQVFFIHTTTSQKLSGKHQILCISQIHYIKKKVKLQITNFRKRLAKKANLDSQFENSCSKYKND